MDGIQPKLLVVAGSPRRDGNTDLLARQVLEGALSAGAVGEILYLRDYIYSPCIACDGCHRKGRCVFQDDAAAIFNKILEADRFVLAAPIYSMGICAQAKMFIDRSQQFWACKYILKRPVIEENNRIRSRAGLFISTAGTDMPGVFDGALRVARYFFKMLDIRMEGAYCFAGVDRKGDILEHDEPMAKVYEAGKRLVRLA